MPFPTVFISYSHQDEAWKNKLLPQLHALEQAGIDMRVWHDRKIDGGDQWYPEIQEAMANAAVGVLLISPDFSSLWLHRQGRSALPDRTSGKARNAPHSSAGPQMPVEGPSLAGGSADDSARRQVCCDRFSR